MGTGGEALLLSFFPVVLLTELDKAGSFQRGKGNVVLSADTIYYI